MEIFYLHRAATHALEYDMAEMCHCGKPLHYRDPVAQRVNEEFIARFGPDIPISVGDRTWNVQRHYVALHGIKAWELPSLGFPEIIKKKVTARYVKKSLCACGFPVLEDHIAFGQKYTIQIPGNSGTLRCGGCQAMIPVTLVWATRPGIEDAGELPLEIFKVQK